MRTIKLTQDQVAMVDDDVFEEISRWKWCAQFNYHTSSFFAVRANRDADGCRGFMLMHRQIMGAGSGEVVDHANHNTLDNRKENLRKCDYRENNWNTSKKRTNRSGFKGVYYHKQINRWRAVITVEYKNISLGCYGTPAEAGRAYDAAALKYFGEFAYTNEQMGLFSKAGV